LTTLTRATAFNDRITHLRKEKGLSQEELGAMIGTSGAVIGRYERGLMSPSIEIAKKLAEALQVTLDYLFSDDEVVVRDKKALKLLADIERLSGQDKENIFYTLENLIKAAKIKTL
jgi:transcriptional regulator with XRE-family HTH domain